MHKDLLSLPKKVQAMLPKKSFIILQDDESFLDHNNLLREEKNSKECRERAQNLFSKKCELTKLQKKLLTHTLTEKA